MERLPFNYEVSFWLAAEYQASSIADLRSSKEGIIKDAIEAWPTVETSLAILEGIYVEALHLAHVARQQRVLPERRTPFYFYGIKVLIPSVRHSFDFDSKNSRKLTVFDQTDSLDLNELPGSNPLIWLHASTEGIHENFAELKAKSWINGDIFVYSLYCPVFHESFSFLGLGRRMMVSPQERAVFNIRNQILGTQGV